LRFWPLRGASTETGVDSSSGSRRPELEYLKACKRRRATQDPQLLFLLMAEYSNANMQERSAGVLFGTTERNSTALDFD
jgi:hypothetical protein